MTRRGLFAIAIAALYPTLLKAKIKLRQWRGVHRVWAVLPDVPDFCGQPIRYASEVPGIEVITIKRIRLEIPVGCEPTCALPGYPKPEYFYVQIPVRDKTSQEDVDRDMVNATITLDTFLECDCVVGHRCPDHERMFA